MAAVAAAHGRVSLADMPVPDRSWWAPTTGYDTRVRVAKEDERPTHTLELDGKTFALIIEAREELIPESVRKRDAFIEELKEAAAYAAVGVAIGVAAACALKLVAVTFS